MLVFCNRFFWPDHSATSQILSDLAFGLADRGHAITVVTSRLRYDGQGELPAREHVRGVEIVRVATTSFGRAHLLGRMIDYLSFYVTATFACLRVTAKGDWLVAKTDPPLLSVPLAVVALARRARLVAWMQDVYPELAAAFGLRAGRGVMGRVLRAARDWSLRQSTVVVVIGERMALYLRPRIRSARLVIIENWTDDAAIVPLEPADNPLREEWGFAAEDLIVGYSGNLGRAHDIDTIIAAAEALRERDDIKFLFVGGGAHRDDLIQRAAAQNLSNVVFRPYQPRAQLPVSQALPDVHWMSLLPAFEGLIVPSKFYSAAASGRPLLMIGDPDGELGCLITQADAGTTLPPGLPDAGTAVAAWLRVLADNPSELRRLGANARSLVTGNRAQARAVKRWEEVFGEQK